ncbi:hypothetical protein C8Q76DRAFT_136038 [Earliella scabrosa]|nr:hypothetical protein C8Q76DRAFT_136038 [Earliella scabrosa]
MDHTLSQYIVTRNLPSHPRYPSPGESGPHTSHPHRPYVLDTCYCSNQCCSTYDGARVRRVEGRRRRWSKRKASGFERTHAHWCLPANLPICAMSAAPWFDSLSEVRVRVGPILEFPASQCCPNQPPRRHEKLPQYASSSKRFARGLPSTISLGSGTYGPDTSCEARRQRREWQVVATSVGGSATSMRARDPSAAHTWECGMRLHRRRAFGRDLLSTRLISVAVLGSSRYP